MPFKNLLFVKRQIHNEYHESVFREGRLIVKCGPHDIRHEELGIHRGVPAKILGKIRDGMIYISFVDTDIARDASIKTFWNEIAAGANQQTLDWTPSKAMCEKVKTVLPQIQAVLHADAVVTVWIWLDGLPDPDDELLIGLRRATRSCGVNATLAQHIFDGMTYALFQYDETVCWPKPPNLHVGWAMKSALYCLPGDNSAEARAERRLPRREQDIDAPWYSRDRPWAMWELCETDSSDNYRGYFPEYIHSGPCEDNVEWEPKAPNPDTEQVSSTESNRGRIGSRLQWLKKCTGRVLKALAEFKGYA